MDSAGTTYKVAAGVMAIYGLACIVGGAIGYFRGGSFASIAAGAPSGILLLVCAVAMFYRPFPALVGAIVVALAIGGFFGSKLAPNLGDLGGFMQSSPGQRAVAMTVGALAVIVTSAIALTMSRPASP
jgi:uncharacterized membrane protein (UPF0136 family)